MVKSSQLVPGRIYTLSYFAPVDMVKSRALSEGADKQPNPLYGEDVFVRRRLTCQAAGEETYTRLMQRINGPEWQKSGRADWASVDPTNSCVLVHDQTQERYLRAIPRGVQHEQYFIGGSMRPATANEVQLIRDFKKNRDNEPPVYVRLKLDNIENLQDDGDEDERPA